ncbi:transglutaminase-like domain-containing protein [Paenibacillus sp. PL91]|uniref:transglutaminase-like domain-containing protein n=1 Tax=Paenibacillus sp. PL91 TaxID=2729538 RepID=UPI00145D3CEA|nr:transglutaminase family protein [Paenibacillus sp. PL91]MBC9198470.1 transglutaminase family protein [Paenibacillus sp. PL91]
MNLKCESDFLDDYLAETEDIDFSRPSMKEKSSELFIASHNENDFVKKAYEFVRDEIDHSWDIRSSRITHKASDVLLYKEGICYAKSILLAALLRSKGIPTGFCYQKLTLGDTPDTGYCIHALNAVYINSIGKWIRLDARGNKAGVDAEFSLSEEKLAFAVRPEFNELDYSEIYISPHAKTIEALKQNTDCMQMCLYGLPTSL